MIGKKPMNTFNPSPKELKSSLNNMLLKGINAFEDGFEILDLDLEIDEQLTVDILAKDAKGNPVVVLLGESGEENLITQILNTLCRLRKHRYLLQRIYRDHSLDFSVPARILLLSNRFPDEFIEKLDFIVAGDIVPYEYSSLKVEDKEFITFTRRDISETGEIKAFQIDKGKAAIETTPKVEKPSTPPAPTPEPKKAIAPEKKSDELDDKDKKKGDSLQSDRFYHEAKKKILRISNDIVESIDEPYSRFRIDDKVLVTLAREKSVFLVYLGDTNDKSLKINTEDQLNDALNQIFKRYFTAFSSITKS